MKITTLIVEDDDMVRKVITHRLKENSALKIVGEADSFDVAVASINKLKPELLFLDVHLWDGKTATDLLSKVEYKAKIVLVSGYNDFIFDAVDLGAIAFLSKPFSKQDISIVIDKVIKAL